MLLNYPELIRESSSQLAQHEHDLRGKPLGDRARMLRLLKSGQVIAIPACAQALGYSARQLYRWWHTYRSEGLDALLQRGPYAGRPTRLHAQAWQGLEEQMRQGKIASIDDARTYLREHWNITYASLHGVWHQLQRHHAKPKTGRPHHRRQRPEQQVTFKKTSRIS